ncbi:hypothetical protein [Siphonobacter sp.]|uniref:hypothetical protein n=1 Tax=Siphonobacter sp. TaxID=1869184 RepID=UPI003B3A59E7
MKNFFRISVLLVGVLLAGSHVSFGQAKKYAVGFKVGEPLGLNARMYLNNNRAIDVGLGTYGMLWGRERKYGPHGRFKNTGWTLNANYLFHTGNEGKRFQAYYGFGGQITSRRSFPDRLASINGYENKTGIGASGLAGVEYFLRDSPLSLFADAGLYVELLPVPIFMHVQGGIGVRFNF